MKGIVVAFLFLVSGCATERIVPVEIKIPVPVPCLSEPVAAPEIPKEKGANIYEKVRALLVEIELRKSYEESLKAAIAACEFQEDD